MEQVRATRRGPLRGLPADDPRLEAIEGMREGLEELLRGLAAMEAFEQSPEAEILNQGWVEMMRGYRRFKGEGERLATLAE